jgi:hypothetical protein
MITRLSRYNQATRLNDRRLLTAQRQALAGHISYLQGNRHLQRVIADSRPCNLGN